MIWSVQPSKRTKGAYTIKTTKWGPKKGYQPAGWGLSAWHAHGAKRNSASSRVAVHNGNYWLMDWYICPSKRTKGTYTIKTSGVHSKTSAKQPAGWGLAAWQLHGGKRNSGSSWVYVHSGNRWLMDWRLIRKAPHKRAARERKTKSVRKEKAVKADALRIYHRTQEMKRKGAEKAAKLKKSNEKKKKEKAIKIKERNSKAEAKKRREMGRKAKERADKARERQMKALERKGKEAKAKAHRIEQAAKKRERSSKAQERTAKRRVAEQKSKEANAKKVAKEKSAKEKRSKAIKKERNDKEKKAKLAQERANKAHRERQQKVARERAHKAAARERRSKAIAREKRDKEKKAKAAREQATKAQERANKKKEQASKAQERGAKAQKERTNKANERQAKQKANAAAAAAREQAAKIKAQNCRTRYWTTNKWYANSDCCRGCDGRSPAPGGMRGVCYRRNKLGWATSRCNCRATPRGSFNFNTNRYYFGTDCCAGCSSGGASCIARHKGALATSVCTCRLSC